MAKKSADVTTVDFYVTPKSRSGEDLDQRLVDYVLVALDDAVEMVQGQSGMVPKPTTVGSMRERTKLADELEAVPEGEHFTMSSEQFQLVEKCVSMHYMPQLSGRILASLVEAHDPPPEDEKPKEPTGDEKPGETVVETAETKEAAQ